MPATQHTHRHLIALPRGQCAVALAWRLLPADPPDAAFTVERREGDAGPWERAGAGAVRDATSLIDHTPHPATYAYRVCAADGTPSESVHVDSGAPPSSIVVEAPLDPDDEVGGIALGDLENEGRIGYLLRLARRGRVWIAAYAHTGTLLWEADTHLPAAGGWDGSTLHVPFLAWDLDGDGRTEVAFHSRAGASPAEHYDQATGDEHLTVVDAHTGELAWRAPWPATRARVMMTVGHLRGRDAPAAVVILDGSYGDVTLTAVDGASGQVSWRVAQARPAGHNLDVGDIDGDGVQEVICGGVCYAGDGRVRWVAEPFGHTDISKPARIDPRRPGMQIWYAVESHNPGVYLVDQDGKTLFKEPFLHAHYGWVARHAPGVAGLHPHTAEDSRRGVQGSPHFPIYLPDGTHWLNLTDWQRKNFVPVHWDEGPEVVFAIRKKDTRVVRLLPDGRIEDLPEGKLPEGGQYGRNLACADVVGDYRENVVTVDTDRHRLIVLANPTAAHHRGCSPYVDFAYRHDRSQHGSGYYVYLSPPDTVVNR